MRNWCKYIILITLVLCSMPVLAQNPTGLRANTIGSAGSGTQELPLFTREIPEVKPGWAVDSESLSATETYTTPSHRLMSVGEGRFFSVFVYVQTVSGTPDIDLFILGSPDKDSTHLARDLNGTYQVLDDFTDNDEWIYTYISPSPCAYLGAKVVCNAGSGDCIVSVVIFKTGS